MIDKRKQIIEILPYDSNWQKEFEKESILLKNIFADNVVAVHHIGSTSVPTMFAKPTIDILLEVNLIDQVDRHNNEMEKLGYEAWGEYGISGRRFFVKGNEKRTHHVHAFQTNNRYDINRHLAVRDYLIVHPDEAKSYADLKIKLSTQFSHNRKAYLQNKNDYVKALEEIAMRWHNR